MPQQATRSCREDALLLSSPIAKVRRDAGNSSPCVGKNPGRRMCCQSNLDLLLLVRGHETYFDIPWIWQHKCANGCLSLTSHRREYEQTICVFRATDLQIYLLKNQEVNGSILILEWLQHEIHSNPEHPR